FLISLSDLYSVRMICLSFALKPVSTIALNQLPPKLYSHGSAMANTMQQISASIGTAILVTLVAMGTKNASVIQGLSERQAQLTGFEWAFMGSTLLALFAFILA